MGVVDFCVLSADQLEKAFHLRYDVYVTEKGFEPANKSGIETDEHDHDAVHIGAVKDGEVIGYARLILPGKPMPVYKHCTLYPDFRHLPTDPQCAEISRLAIAKAHRSRGMTVRLFGAINSAHRDNNLNHCVAAMEPGLAWLIQRAGFHVERIGPSAEYHGTRSPYLLTA